MWDFLPVNLNEIKQIEVIRGPASAVWGANAVNGVINVITKSPREMQGTTATIGLGMFERTDGRGRRIPVVRQWHACGSGQRSLGVQAFRRRLRRRIRCRARPGSSPASPVTPTAPQGTPYPAVQEHRHDAAEVRRPRRLRLRGRPRAVIHRAACRAPKASCTPALAPSTSTAVR